MNFPWFRLYTEFASDPKVQIHAFEDQRHYVMILCLKGNGTLDTDTPSNAYRERLIAKALGLDPITAAEAKRRLVEGGLIGTDWQPLRWVERQPKSDHDAAERKREYRERVKQRTCPNDVPRQSEDSPVLEESRLGKDRAEETNTQAGRLNVESTPSETDPPIDIVPRETDPEWFLDFKLAMPDRAGNPNWSGARRAANARIKEGYKPAEFIAGAHRYRIYCDAVGSTGTQYVKTAAVFLGPDKHFESAWPLPLTKAGVRLKTNISAAEEFMRRTETTV